MGLSTDATVRLIGVDKGTAAMLKKLELDAKNAGTGLGNAVEKGSSRASAGLNKLGNTATNFGIPFAAVLSNIAEKFDQTSTKGKKFVSVVSEVGKGALIGGAAGLVAFGGEAIKLGNDLEDSQAKLGAALKASGTSFSESEPKLAAYRKQMESLGFTNADANHAIATSVISTQNLGKSLGLSGIAADLAREKHIGLSDAMNTVDKAVTGNLKGIKALGIDLPIAGTSALKLATASDAVAAAQRDVNAILERVPGAANKASAAHGIYEKAVAKLSSAQGKLAEQSGAADQITNALAQRLGGQASAYADTFTGKTEVLTARLKDMGAKVGQFLVPKLESLMGLIDRNRGVVEGLAIAVGVVLGAAITVFAVTKVSAFVKGTEAMIAGLGRLAAMMTGTTAVVAAEDATIVAANEAAGASFTAMLGPIAAAGAAIAIVAIATDKLLRKIFDLKATSSLGAASEAYAKQHGGSDAIHDARVAAAKGDKDAIAFLNAKKPSTPFVSKAPTTGVDDAITKLQDDANKKLADSLVADSAAKAVSAAATRDATKATAQHNREVAAAKKAHDLLTASIKKTTDATRSLISDALKKASTSLATAQTAFDNFKSSVSSAISGSFSFSAAQSEVAQSVADLKSRLDTANGSLQTAQNAFDSYASSVSNAITSQLSFNNAQTDATNNGTDFMSSLRTQASAATAFAAKVDALLAGGLSEDALQQVLAAGSNAGTLIADSLLAGGAGAISDANALTASVKDVADRLGGHAASRFRQAGIDSAQAIVDGINATLPTTLMQALSDQADKTTNFTNKVRDLMFAGLSRDALTQVLAAGADSGTAIADSLLAGGATSINQANLLTGAVSGMADSLGTSAAENFFSAGVAQAQSILKGLQTESKRMAPKLRAASKAIAEHLKAQVTIDLKIISQGGTITKLASGGIVTSPTLALIGEAGPEAVIPLRGGGTASNSGGGGDVYLTVNGANMTPQELVNALRVDIQRNGSLGSRGVK